MNFVNKAKIAKNSLFLYLRTIVSICVGLLSSRILLRELGIDDYGLYNLVGSIVTMFASLRVILATSTQRFLNSENGCDLIIQRAIIFKTSVKIHWWLCILFFIVSEIAGFWILGKANIPEGQETITFILLQLSIITAIVSITTIPYDAVIIANEKFNTYAFFAILESVLKLLSAALLFFVISQKIIYYASFILISTILIRVFNIWYCKEKFEECKIKANPTKNVATSLCKFAGWNFLGNSAYTFCNEGINIILNLFGGVAVNAARSIAYQILNAITEICGKLITASSPQAIRIYTAGEFSEFNNILIFSTKIIILLYMFIAIPLLILTNGILQLWLDEIPPNTVIFIHVVIAYGYIRTLHFPIDLIFKASGKMAAYQLIELFCLLSAIPLAYYFLRIGFPYYYAFTALIITNIINTILILILAKAKTHFNATHFIVNTIIPSVCILAFIVLLAFVLKSIDKVLLVTILEVVLFLLSYIIGLSKPEKKQIKCLFNRKT